MDRCDAEVNRNLYDACRAVFEEDRETPMLSAETRAMVEQVLEKIHNGMPPGSLPGTGMGQAKRPPRSQREAVVACGGSKVWRDSLAGALILAAGRGKQRPYLRRR